METAQTVALFGLSENSDKNVGWILKQWVYRFIPLAVGNLHIFVCFLLPKAESI